MHIAEIILLGFGLSMDAFAAALGKGISLKKWDPVYTVVIGFVFGAGQMIMPILGWVAGVRLRGYIAAFDHWIAFVLLGYIGGKMICDSVSDNQPEVAFTDALDVKEIALLSVAVSIDALAAGVTLAFLNVNIVFSSCIIGCTTFILSCMGVCAGYLFGAKIERYAAKAGGLLLICIGTRILTEHLFG